MPDSASAMPSQNNEANACANLGAVILCGGRSRRMGADKWKLQLNGKSLLDHVIDQVALAAAPVVLVSNEHVESPNTDRDVMIVSDENEKAGPLEGIRVGLNRLRSENVEFGFITGCDVPLLNPNLMRHLFSHIEDFQAVVPFQHQVGAKAESFSPAERQEFAEFIDKRIFGLTAVYRTDIGKSINRLFAQDKRRVMHLAANLKAKLIDVESMRKIDPQLNSLMNINDPADFERLRATGLDQPDQ